VPHRIAVVAPSHDDAVNTCVRGETGLLQANRLIHFSPGALLRADLTWPNGAEAELFGAFNPEDVERFRGPQHCLIWGDELAAWRKLDDIWDMIQFGLRLGPKPRMVLTTTPKARPRVRWLLARGETAITKARTSDNPHLPGHRLTALYQQYGGTRLGRQELEAELLEDVEGALWSLAMIDSTRRLAPQIQRNGVNENDLARVVVAIDPAVSVTEDSDETGIIIAGLGYDGRGYVLDDRSAKAHPLDWGKRAIAAFDEFGADRILGEVNNGGEMIETVLRTIRPSIPYKAVHASKGKRTRAEPIAALYEQGRVSHTKPLPDLEDQLCTFTPESGQSPDRLDALVWALTDLMLGSTTTGDFSLVA
jgi:predicted phage terminase large subunit-like protein